MNQAISRERMHRTCPFLRRIFKGFDSKNLLLAAVFDDFKIPFDSIYYNVMFKILRHHGVPEPMTNAIRILYENTRLVLIIDDTTMGEFEVNTGKVIFLFSPLTG